MKTLLMTSVAFALTAGSAVLAADKAEVLGNYADIAQAKYQDSLITAQRLQEAVANLIANPSAEAQQAAKAAWFAARVPYQQSEAYRSESRRCFNERTTR